MSSAEDDRMEERTRSRRALLDALTVQERLIGRLESVNESLVGSLLALGQLLEEGTEDEDTPPHPRFLGED